MIPRLGASDSYKHMGIWRTINGDTTAAARAFHDKAREVTARLLKLQLPVLSMFRAADIVLGGSLAYPGTSTTVSRDECDTAEAGWRALLTHRSARAMSAPRADMYGPGKRTHVYAAVGAGQLHAVFRAVGDAHDTGLRRGMRSELARAMHRLGCRSNPLEWNARHLIEPLRTQFARP
jgi:hypothetical protein